MRDLASWVGDRLGVRLVDAPGNDSDDLALADLAGLAVRRNPRRAHLVVSTVLGKHLPVDPRLSYAAARLLGERAAASLGGPAAGPASPGLRSAGSAATGATRQGGASGGPGARASGASASGRAPDLPAGFRTALRGDGVEPAKLCAPDDPGVTVPEAPLVLGYAETATALGHGVADAFADARYLHSTRRAVPGYTAAGTFDEAHSHATEHLLLPADRGWLAAGTPVVLVDDELTTGRTAAATIRALHRLGPRRHYVVAALLDLRTAAERTVLADLAAELGTRIDVVALAAGAVELPPDVLAAAQDLVNSAAVADEHTRVHPGGSPESRTVTAAWPSGVPEGGRHGFAPAHRQRLAAAVDTLAAEVAAGLPGGRILVLGTEELMYAPLRLALALTEHRDDVRFSSTTRSPVFPVDEPGYAIRTRLQFTAPEPDPTGAARFAYNVANGGFDGVVVVVDTPHDTPALWAPDGLVEALRPVCGAVTVAVIPTVAA